MLSITWEHIKSDNNYKFLFTYRTKYIHYTQVCCYFFVFSVFFFGCVRISNSHYLNNHIFSMIRPTQTSFFADAKRFLSPLKDFKWATLQNMFDALWGSLAGFANILLVTNIMKTIETWNIQLFHIWLTVFIVYTIIYWGVRVWLRKWWFVTFRHKLMHKLYGDYTRELFLFENSSFELIGTGKIAGTYEKGIPQWTRLLHVLVRNSTHVLVTGIVMMYIIAGAQPYLLIGFIFLVVSSLTLNRYIARFSAEAKKKRVQLIHEFDRHIVRMAMSKFEILQNDRIEAESNKMENYIDQMEIQAEPLERYARLAFAMPGSAVDLLKISLYFVIGTAIFMKTKSVATLIGAVAMVGIIERNLQYLIDTLDQFQQEFIFVRKFWELFDTTPRMQGYYEWTTFVSWDGSMELDNITHSYSVDGPQVLKNFSLKIAGGKKIAIVGPSGGWKSTLIKLLSGYFLPVSGRILVDGQDLAKVARKTYFSNIGYLTQDPSVFDGTIRENLVSAAWRKCSEEEIKSVLSLTHCEFIWELPEGLETEIGERGVRLSGWQKQRLAIAKIFLKDPEIIFLDEPTSALDSFSEEKISEAFHRLFAGRTVIIVAHRLQTVKEADEILVLDHGQIIERGTHTELIAKHGIYHEMVELQSGF